MGGNLFVEQPYGDLAVALLALDAQVEVSGPTETVSRPVADVLERRLGRGEVVTAVALDVPAPGEWFYTKAMRRRQNSASIVTVAAVAAVEDGTVASVCIALGGVGPRPLRAAAAEAALTGHPFLTDRTSRRPPTPRWRTRTRSTTRTRAPGIAAVCCPSTSAGPCWGGERMRSRA